MRLWHSKLIPLLDGQRLCDLHMSCCNLRGKGWGKRNKNIDYIYSDPLGEDALARYHEIVLQEMLHRGYKPDDSWFDPCYCGKNRPKRPLNCPKLNEAHLRNVPLKGHTLEFYLKDIKELNERGVKITLDKQTHWDDIGSYSIYTASRDNKSTQYGLRGYD